MVEKKDFMGDYNILADEVRDEANSLNKAYDLKGELAQIDEDVNAVEQRVQEWLDAALENLAGTNLAGDETVQGDELLQEYDEIVRKAGDRRLTERFEEMLLLGSRLIPGELFLMGDEVKEIAEPGEEGTDEEKPVEPLLMGKVTFNHGTQYSLAWSVSVSRLSARAIIDNETPVGRESIKSKLDKVHIDYQNTGHDVEYAVVKLARAYAAIGDVEGVNRPLNGYLQHFSHRRGTQFPAF